MFAVLRASSSAENTYKKEEQIVKGGEKGTDSLLFGAYSSRCTWLSLELAFNGHFGFFVGGLRCALFVPIAGFLGGRKLRK